MEKANLEPIVRTYYEALEEGRILGRKCTRCGHIEYPPYLICNTCGCLDTQWYDMKDEKFVCTQLMPESAAFSEPAFRANVGTYFVAAVRSEHSDEIGSCVIHMDPARYDGVAARLPLPVRPVICQDEDVKMVLWELDE